MPVTCDYAPTGWCVVHQKFAHDEIKELRDGIMKFRDEILVQLPDRNRYPFAAAVVDRLNEILNTQ